MTDNNKIKAQYYTLGCKLNFSETSAIATALRSRGILRATVGESPDIIILNSCSVTETADKKGRSLIRRLHSRYPDVPIVVTGCYAQLKPREVADLPGVVLVIGNNEKGKADEFIHNWLIDRKNITRTTPFKDFDTFFPSCQRGDRTRYFLKIQDGCDYFCTYCTIPYARGKSRSGRIEDIVDMTRNAAIAGAKEIVITGVNIGDFGADTGESFFDLLKALDDIQDIHRYRISSIEPNLLSEDIIKWIASEARAFTPHFHIPLQSGSDHVLKLMNRRYDTALFKNRIELIKDLLPDAFIGIDIIAGARGETDEEWEKSFDFIKNLPVTKLHVFPYSERPGTAALHLPEPVAQEVKHQRVNRLTALSDNKLADFMKQRIGKIYDILWEQPQNGNHLMHGFTPNYLRVTAPYDSSLINKISRVRIEGIDSVEPDTFLVSHV